jgi:hypothetical protein
MSYQRLIVTSDGTTGSNPFGRSAPSSYICTGNKKGVKLRDKIRKELNGKKTKPEGFNRRGKEAR